MSSELYDRLDRLARYLNDGPGPRLEHQLLRSRWKLLGYEENAVRAQLEKVNP